MPRHQAERLDVHDEAVRRPLGPAAHHLLGRDAVVRRVDLDGREALGVVREALPRRRARRVPVLRERVVGPRARADPDRRRHRRSIREGPGRAPLRASRCARALLRVRLDDDGAAEDSPPTVASMHGRPPKIGRRRAGRRAEVVVEEIGRPWRSGPSAPSPCRCRRARRRSASPTCRPSSMNEPVAPPTFLPAAAIVIARRRGLPFVGHGRRELHHACVIDLDAFFLPLTRCLVGRRRFFFATLSLKLRSGCAGSTASRRVPAAFGVPLPGVVRRPQRRPAVVAGRGRLRDRRRRRTSPRAASRRTCARPGVPAGTSGGGRQTTSFACSRRPPRGLPSRRRTSGCRASGRRPSGAGPTSATAVAPALLRGCGRRRRRRRPRRARRSAAAPRRRGRRRRPSP